MKGLLSYGEDFGLCSKAMESPWKGLKRENVHLSCVGKAHSGCRLRNYFRAELAASWTWEVKLETDRQAGEI